MAIELNITPEDIDALVRDSIMKAGFGKVINEAIGKIFTGYNSPIEERLRTYIAEISGQLLRDKFSAQIKAAVAAAIEEKITPQMINTVVAAATEKMARAAE